MVDADPQASLTKYAGHEPAELEERGKTLFQGLSARKALRGLILSEDDGTPHLIAASKNPRHDVGAMAERRKKRGNQLLREGPCEGQERLRFHPHRLSAMAR